jgi:putative Mg2+ transporter-C (MgtC) family protein
LDILISAHPLTWMEALARLAAAMVIGFVIGIEREYMDRPAGMRTHSLVCMGAAVAALLECLLLFSPPMGSQDLDASISMGRISSQVISGVGFLGAGTILVMKRKISGLTTAASVWNAACVGLMVGFGYYYLALFTAVLVMLVLFLLRRVVHINAVKRVEVRFADNEETVEHIREFFQKNGIRVLETDNQVVYDRKAGGKSECLRVNVYSVRVPHGVHFSDLVAHLSDDPAIESLRTVIT